MKLKIKVTKDILRRSMMCGTVISNSGLMTPIPSSNCAIAVAIRDIFPSAAIGTVRMLFIKEEGDNEAWGNSPYGLDLDKDTQQYISKFDSSTPEKRLEMPEYEFTIEVPNAVIGLINIEALEACPTMELVGD